MIKITSLLFVICISTATQAQNTFEKTIDTLGASFANCVQPTFDGGYILCGGSNNGGNDAIVVKLDSTGSIEWAKTYSGPSIEGAVYIEQTPDSGYILDGLYDGGGTNSQNWLIRLNANGDTLWTKTFTAGTTANEPHQLTRNKNGDFGLTGVTMPPVQNDDAYLIITDSIGVVKSNKVYTTIYGSTGLAINTANQNNYIITGGIATSSIPGIGDAFLMLIDSIGDTLWTKSYNNSQVDVGMAVQQTNDHGFVIAGYSYQLYMGKYNYNVYLIKTDSIGDTLWTKVFYSAGESEAYSVQQTFDNGYIMTGTTYASGIGNYYDLLLIKTDSLGDSLWTRRFGGNQPDYGYFVRQTKDGGYIITGSGSNTTTGGIYLIKTDSMGRVTSTTGIAELNNPFGFTVYPNPSSGIFTVQVKGIQRFNSKLEVYDLNNQCIYSCSINNNSSDEIDLSNLTNGMYVLLLRTDKNVYTKKIIIEK